jgi:hypothetical protein
LGLLEDPPEYPLEEPLTVRGLIAEEEELPLELLLLPPEE